MRCLVTSCSDGISKEYKALRDVNKVFWKIALHTFGCSVKIQTLFKVSVNSNNSKDI